MIPYELAVLVKVFNELPTEVALKAIAEAGYTAEEVLKILSKYTFDE